VQIADTSAWTWSRRAGEELRTRFDAAVDAGLIATCAAVELELLYSARGSQEFANLRIALESLPQLAIGEREWKRALDVYQRLADQGGLHHRAVKHPDLLVAAAAELACITVLHYDEDFDRIGAITGQPTCWIAPRGSL
jgi:predicted nucleic acid-binding protein